MVEEISVLLAETAGVVGTDGGGVLVVVMVVGTDGTDETGTDGGGDSGISFLKLTRLIFNFLIFAASSFSL